MRSDQAVGLPSLPRPVEAIYERTLAIAEGSRDRLAVVVVAVFAHGWLLLNNGIYWDDWLLYTQLKNANWSQLTALADQLGGIPTYLYIWAAAAALPPSIFAFKLIAFLLIVASGLLIQAIARYSGLVTRGESVAIACLAVAYPGDHTHVLLITLPYLVYWVAFLAGFLLLVHSENARGRSRWLLRAAAVIALFFSFSLNSLLSFYFGALLIGAIYLRRRKQITMRRLLTVELLKRIDLVLIPFLFWDIYRIFFPPNGIYGYYHQFILDPVSLQFAVSGFWQSGLIAQFRDSLLAVISGAILWVGLLVVVNLLWSRIWRDAVAVRRSLAMLGLGVLLLVLAAIPYIAVGLAPTDAGWSSRHTILFGLPVAMIVLALAQILFRTRDSSIGVVGGAALATLVLGFALDTAHGYISWEARWLKDSSFTVNMAATTGADKYSVYWIDDQYPLGGEPSYRFYEWSALIGRAFGGQSRVGMDDKSTPPYFVITGGRFFNPSYDVVGFDPSGCEANVTIKRGRTAGTELGMTIHYYWYSLVNPSYRDSWLAGLTSVDVEPHPSFYATSCAVPR